MKILHTSDWHLGKKLDGCERINEQKKFLSDLLNIIENNDIDILIAAGDIYDSPNPPIEAEKIYYDFVKKIGDLKKCCVIMIAGNHDSGKRLTVTRNIEKDYGIILLENPMEILEEGDYGISKISNSHEGCFEIEIRGKKSFISFLPYISDIEGETILKNFMTADEEENISLMSYSEKIKNIFKIKEKHRDENIPYIAVGHIFVSNIEGEESESSLDFGGAYTVKLSDLPKADYTALGHIHKPMKFLKYKAFYSGSPIEYRVSENRYGKKIFIADVEKDNLKIDEIDITNYKPINKYFCESIEKAIILSEEKMESSEWIYLEISSERTLVAGEVKKIKENKNIVDIYLKLKGNTYESEEILDDSMEKNIKEAFVKYYKFTNNNIDTEPSSELLNLFDTLISEESREEDI